MIDWELFDKNLKEIKYPHFLIFRFFNIIHLIDDYYAAIILRFIIKNNIDIFKNEPYYFISSDLPKEYTDTSEILESFYLFFIERTNKLNQVKKWFKVYDNKEFWQKNINDQINYLHNLRNKVKGIFDNYKSPSSFVDKMGPIIKLNINNSKYLIFDSAIERLSKIAKLFGKKVFKSLKIPMLSIDEFLDLEDENKIKYTFLVYSKILQLLQVVINIFEEFNMADLKLNNLLNPKFINIEEIEIDEVDDISEYFL
jgi:hypothetical protein